MELYKNNFNFEESYKQMDSVYLVDPQTVLIDGKYTPVNKQASKVINENYGMRSLQFSNQLYNHDKDIWNELLDKKTKDPTIENYKKSHYAVIINDEVVSVLDNDKIISEFMKIISDYVKEFSDSLEFFYNYHNNEFQFMPLKSNEIGKSGVIIRYYLSDNWITIHNVFYSNDNNFFYISPEPITSKVIEDDLNTILNKDELLILSSTSYDEYKMFETKALQSKISMEELFSYLKSDFKIKIKYTRIDPIDYLSSHNEISTEVSKLINDILVYIYDTDAYRFINSPYLKKSIEFSKFSFYQYCGALSDMVFDNLLNIDSLIRIIRLVSNNKTNYNQING